MLPILITETAVIEFTLWHFSNPHIGYVRRYNRWYASEGSVVSTGATILETRALAVVFSHSAVLMRYRFIGLQCQTPHKCWQSDER